MRFCRRLLRILLILALVPLIISSAIHRYSLWRFGNELASGTRLSLTENATAILSTTVRNYTTLINRQKESVEERLRLQVREVFRPFPAPNQAPGTLRFADEFDTGAVADLEPSRHHSRLEYGTKDPPRVSYQHASVYLSPGLSAQDVTDQIQLYADLNDSLALFHNPEIMAWQYITFPNGLHICYPGHGRYPRDYDPREREWYARAVEAEGVQWTLVRDVTTRAITMVATQAVRNEKGELLAVTAIDVPYGAVFQELDLPESWQEFSVALLVQEGDERDGHQGRLMIVARSPLAAPEQQDWRSPIVPDFLEVRDPEAMTELQHGIREHRSGVLTADFQGNPCLWAYSGGEVSAVVIVPEETIVAKAREAESHIRQRTVQGLTISGLFLLAVAALAVFFAFSIARSVTQPVRQLAQASAQLAEGDFSARVSIDTGDELQELAQIFNATGPKLQERARMKHSLALAEEMQQHLLPTHAPQLPGFELVGRSVYCEETGGDYFDFIDLHHLHGHKLGIAVGDVSGHGMGAAFLMASARAVLRAHASFHGADLRSTLRALNQHLSRDTEDAQFMTLFYGILDAETHEFQWTSGGHDPAIWLRCGDGSLTELENTGMALGIVDNIDFEQPPPIKLRPHDVILIGTDGIWEARNSEGEMFGKQRLRDVITACKDRSAHDVFDAVVEAVNRFVGDEPQGDDITLVIIRASSAQS